VTLAGDVVALWRCAALVLRRRGVVAPGHATMPAFDGTPTRRPTLERQRDA
jgi:hypothetical protein